MIKKNLIVSVVLYVIAFIALYLNYNHNKKSTDILNESIYKPIVGKIETSTLDEQIVGTSTQTLGNVRTIINNKKYKPSISFSYTVNGINYTSTKPTIDDFPYTRYKAEALLITNRFTQGSQVPVYYNVKNPNEAYLIRTDKKMFFGYIASGVLSVVSTLILLNKIPINKFKTSLNTKPHLTRI